MNHSSIKDAVVLFGGGCTGGGLERPAADQPPLRLFADRPHSTLEDNILENGFYARNRSGRINPSLSVTFIKRIER